MKHLSADTWVIAILVFIFVIVGPAAWIIQSHFEAAAFNRLTHGNATTWDAMWTELRVMGQP